jgi:hypothetical protein
VFYTQVLSNTLEERLKDVLQLAQDEQISLYEDLALARETVAATVELFSVADTNHMEKGTEQSLQHKIAAGQIMREAQKDLLAICEAIGKQEERRANRTGVSVAAIAFIARQLTAAAAQIYGDDLDKAREFERIAKSIRLPGSAAEIVGTLIEPGEDVLAMDATVPREESGEYNED